MPFELLILAFALAYAAAWIGHAFLWTTVLNYVYARPYSKTILKAWRLATGLGILLFPQIIYSIMPPSHWASIPDSYGAPLDPFNGTVGRIAAAYSCLCLGIGGIIYPAINAYRLTRKPPEVLLSETTHTLDLWKELGTKAIGEGKGAFAAKLPFNCIYRVDFTELELAIPNLPPEWNGLTILHLSDVHYHGTPSRAFHERVGSEIETRWPRPDLVCLTGDYVDTDEHHAWIGPLLGRLHGTEWNFAILGNHDVKHNPERVREALVSSGYRVLGNGWQEATIRGVRCVMVGHEGPWFDPPPDLAAAPAEGFRLCLSHTPDNFYWGQANRVNLMLCGHVHGGQIRLPVISSIFVPSVYGRRFDMGVFEGQGTTMVVGRGLSGKEPLRFRCHPQVIRITLKSSEGAREGE